MTIVGTRPEIIKLSQVIKELDKFVEHTIVHTGQNYDYELNELFFEQLDIRKPDIFLEAIKGTPSETIGDIISKADKQLPRCPKFLLWLISNILSFNLFKLSFIISPKINKFKYPIL